MLLSVWNSNYRNDFGFGGYPEKPSSNPKMGYRKWKEKKTMLLLTDDRKRVKIDMDRDTRLYSAPVNPPNTSLGYTSGRDLYMHKSRSGKNFYYIYSWSMWQGTESTFYLISEEEAKDFILEKACCFGHGALDWTEIEQAKNLFGDDFFDENA